MKLVAGFGKSTRRDTSFGSIPIVFLSMSPKYDGLLATVSFQECYSSKFGCLSYILELGGCGSWNADSILNHPFDRGAFGFQRARCCSVSYLCCHWPVYGGAVLRHRCQCNGPLWNRMFTDCGTYHVRGFLALLGRRLISVLSLQAVGGAKSGTFSLRISFDLAIVSLSICHNRMCSIPWCCCVYEYSGLADPDEVAFACSIALQAYFEGRNISKKDMDLCLEFWRKHISEQHDPINRKRQVCCEPVHVPCCDGSRCYGSCHPHRNIPYGDENVTEELKEVRLRLWLFPVRNPLAAHESLYQYRRSTASMPWNANVNWTAIPT